METANGLTKSKIVLGLSGGMDSSTLAAYYINKGYEVYPLIFNYNSKHNKYENECAFKVAKALGCAEPKLVNLDFIHGLFKSNLLQDQGEIPEGHYEDVSMSKTVVPGRNSIFICIMAGYAESIGASKIAVGVHAGDHHIYPDCRPNFINAINLAVEFSSDGKVTVEAPFLNYTKFDILKIGYGLSTPVPYELTRTCYKDQPISCGKCGSCTERLEAFSLLGKKDPIEYENV